MATYENENEEDQAEGANEDEETYEDDEEDDEAEDAE